MWLRNEAKHEALVITGRNPNVFYELGIAHTMGKEVVIITQSAADVPFDIRHRRYLQYDPSKLSALKVKLEKTIKQLIIPLVQTNNSENL